MEQLLLLTLVMVLGEAVKYTYFETSDLKPFGGPKNSLSESAYDTLNMINMQIMLR